MNQKPDMPEDDDRFRKHPAKRPSGLDVDRKLDSQAQKDAEADGRKSKPPFARGDSPRDSRRDSDKHVA